MKLRYLVCLAALGLAACDQAPKKTAAATAEGEILPGSASDSMLPLDTLRSQAPLAPKVVSSDSAGRTKPACRANCGCKACGHSGTSCCTRTGC